MAGAAGAPLSVGPWRVWAATSQVAPARLLVVFLRGAYDGLSALVPYADPFYYDARPNIAIGRPAGEEQEAGAVNVATDTCWPLDNRWGLHPALVASLGPLWRAGGLAFVPFAGTDFVSRSHFQAQDWVESGLSAAERPDGRSGFLNRLLQELGIETQRSGVAFATQLPPAMRGAVPVANSSIGRGVARRPGSAAEALALQGFEDRVLAMYAGHALEPLVREGLGLRRELSMELQQEMQAASRNALPASGFALEAARMGRLFSERPQYAVGFVDVGGWDTHAGQGAAQGALATRLRALGEGLSSMAEALGQAEWRRTVVVVMSEFGRTFRENGTRGTDHGHGTTLWVLGGGVRGGAVRGEQAPIAPGALHQDRDLPVLNEYRSVLSSLVGRTFGLERGRLQAVWPGASAVDLGLV